MATQTKSKPNTASDNAEAAADRVREVNERIIESSKKAGNVYLDLYEKTLHSIADYQEKVGEQSQVEWVTHDRQRAGQLHARAGRRPTPRRPGAFLK